MAMQPSMIYIFLLIFSSILLTITVYPIILKKAGFSSWWTILAFIPGINLIIIWIFAFIDWPVMKNNEDLEEIFE